MDGITVITGPRTGAGHLFALLRNFEAVAPRAGLFAAGHAEAAAAMEAAEREAKAAGQSLLVVKATPALPRDVVERDLLGRSGMRTIFVVRRPIDTYVSLAKATAMNAWRDTDLTPVKVKLDPTHFSGWMDEQESWYRHWAAWLERRAYPLPILCFETHLTMPPESVRRRCVGTAAQVGGTLRMPAQRKFEGLKRQDRGGAAAFKVKNWPDFSKALIERGIEQRAFGYPI